MALPAGQYCTTHNFRVRDTLRPEVYHQSVRFGAKLIQTHDHSFFQLITCGYSSYVTPVWREDESVVYNCCWSSSAQLFSGPSPVGLMTTSYCVRFETPPTWRARSPYLYTPGRGIPVIPPVAWFPFRRLLPLEGLRWSYSTPPPHGDVFHHSQLATIVLLITPRHGPGIKHHFRQFLYCCAWIRCRVNMFVC
jgi:hypothetical protein